MRLCASHRSVLMDFFSSYTAERRKVSYEGRKWCSISEWNSVENTLELDINVANDIAGISFDTRNENRDVPPSNTVCFKSYKQYEAKVLLYNAFFSCDQNNLKTRSSDKSFVINV